MCISPEQFTHIGVAMRTNIEIDDALLAEAMAATGLKTKRKVVETGLRLLARHKCQAAVRTRPMGGRSSSRAPR